MEDAFIPAAHEITDTCTHILHSVMLRKHFVYQLFLINHSFSQGLDDTIAAGQGSALLQKLLGGWSKKEISWLIDRQIDR